MNPPSKLTLRADIFTAQELIRQLLQMPSNTIVTTRHRPIAVYYSAKTDWHINSYQEIVPRNISGRHQLYIGKSPWCELASRPLKGKDTPEGKKILAILNTNPLPIL